MKREGKIFVAQDNNPTWKLVINLTRISEVKIRGNKLWACLGSYLEFKGGMIKYQSNNLDLHSWISIALLLLWFAVELELLIPHVKRGIQIIWRIFKWSCLHSRRLLSCTCHVLLPDSYPSYICFATHFLKECYALVWTN